MKGSECSEFPGVVATNNYRKDGAKCSLRICMQRITAICFELFSIFKISAQMTNIQRIFHSSLLQVPLFDLISPSASANLSNELHREKIVNIHTYTFRLNRYCVRWYAWFMTFGLSYNWIQKTNECNIGDYSDLLGHHGGCLRRALIKHLIELNNCMVQVFFIPKTNLEESERTTWLTQIMRSRWDDSIISTEFWIQSFFSILIKLKIIENTHEQMDATEWETFFCEIAASRP